MTSQSCVNMLLKLLSYGNSEVQNVWYFFLVCTKFGSCSHSLIICMKNKMNHLNNKIKEYHLSVLNKSDAFWCVSHVDRVTIRTTQENILIPKSATPLVRGQRSKWQIQEVSFWTKSKSVQFLRYSRHLMASQQVTPELNMSTAASSPNIKFDQIIQSHAFPPKLNLTQKIFHTFLFTDPFFSFLFLVCFSVVVFTIFFHSCHTVIKNQMMHFYFLHLVGTEKEKWLKTCGVE